MAYAPTWCGQTVPVTRNWSPPAGAARPVLVTGATGTLGRAFARALEHRGHAYVLTDRAQLDVQDPAAMAETLDVVRPWAVVNAAGYVRVDEAEGERDDCFAANAVAVEHMARACAARDLPFLTFSSDLVFDGAKPGPYDEGDAPAPLGVYGESKAAAERAVLDAGARGLVVRTSAFFSPLDPHNFAHAAVQTVAAGRVFRAAADQEVSPTYVSDLVDAALDLVIDGEVGVRHLANRGRASWAAFAVKLAEALGLEAELVEAVPAAALGQVAPRPDRVELATRFGALMPTLDSAVQRYAAAVRPTLKVAPRASPANMRDAFRPSPRKRGAVVGAAAQASRLRTVRPGSPRPRG